MVLLSIFFTRIRSTEGSSADCSLFILSLHALALHLAVKILLQIFLYEDLSTLTLHTSVGCISLQNASRTLFCYITNTINSKTFLIFDINHQQNTRRQTRLNDENDNTKLRALVSQRFQQARVAIFKEIFDQVRKDLDCELFYSEHNVTTSHIIFLSF